MSSSILLLLLAAAATVSAETNPGLDDIATLTGAVMIGGNNTACSKKYECISCWEARVCRPVRGEETFEEVVRHECTGDTPFCDILTGSCSSSVQSLECAVQDEFTCFSNGIFPDPRSCVGFYYCRDLISYTFACHKRLFDAKLEKCDDNTICYTFNCYGKHGVKTAHPKAPKYFALCSDDKAIMVDRCPEDTVFFDDKQTCLPSDR